MGVALAVSTLLGVVAAIALQLPAEAPAEAVYLAVWAALMVAVVVAVAPPPALEAALAAVAVVAAVWLLPAQAHPGLTGRGMVVGGVLVAATSTAVWRRLGRGGETVLRLDAGLVVPLALGAQWLLRGDRLLAPLVDPHTLVSVVGLPLAGALALGLLARRHGGERVVVAAAVALVLAPGFNVVVTLALVALAAGGEALDPRRPRPLRLAALAVAVAPLAWEPRSGAVAAAAALAVGGGPAFGLGVAGLSGLAALALPLKPWSEAAALALWLPLLLPAVVVTPPRRRLQLLAALALALAAARCLPAEGAPLAVLAAPLTLAALGLPTAGTVASAQRSWAAALFAGTALLASYPWLRREPLADALGLAGVAAGWPAAVAALALAGVLALLRWRPRRVPIAPVLLAAALALTIVVASPAAVQVANREPLILAREVPAQSLRLAPQPVSELVVDSHLGNAAALPPGTVVATLRLEEADGTAREHALVVGRDTGEWAARRSDVAALGVAAPRPWRSTVDAGGFFAQAYRSRWRLPGSLRPVRLEVRRNPALPAAVVVQISRLELRR